MKHPRTNVDKRKNKWFYVLIASLFFSSVFGLIQYYTPVSLATPINPVTNTAHMAATLAGYTNAGTDGRTSVGLTITASQSSSGQSVSESNSQYSTPWTEIGGSSGYQASLTFNLGTFNYYAGSPVQLYGFEMALPGYVSGGYPDGYGIGSLEAILTISGGNQYTQTWSPNQAPPGTDTYVGFTAYWSSLSGTATGTYSVTLEYLFSLPSGSTSYTWANFGTPFGGELSANYAGFPGGTTGGSFTNTYYSQTPYTGFMYGWSYTSSDSTSQSYPNPASNWAAYQISWTASYSSTLYRGGTSTGQSGTSGTYDVTSNIAYYITLHANSNPSPSSYSVSYQIQNVIVSNTATINNSITQTSNQQGNWWNATLSSSFSPGSWLNGGSADGKTWNSFVSAVTVSDILSVGYGQSPNYDQLTYSGVSSGSISSPSEYSTIIKTGLSYTDNSAYTLTYNIAELINYDPQVSSVSTSWTSGSSMSLSFTGIEQITQGETGVVNWGDGQTSSFSASSVTSSGHAYTLTHTYSGTFSGSFSQSEPISITINNHPNAPSSSYGSAYLSHTETPSPYIFSSSFLPTQPNLALSTGQSVYMNLTNSNINFGTPTVTVNGATQSPVEVGIGTNTVDWQVSSSSFGYVSSTVSWTFTGGGISDSESVSYGTELAPTATSPHLTALFSNSYTGSYPITLNNVPQVGEVPITLTNSQTIATGTYQQLITFPTSTYKNSITTNFTNIYFAYQNGTTIPSWIESQASNTYSSTPIWLKLNSIPASSSITVYAHIVPNSNFFEQKWANIGEAPNLSPIYGQYDNGQTVFSTGDYWNFTSGLPSGWYESGVLSGISFNNGLHIIGKTNGGAATGLNITSTTSGIFTFVGEMSSQTAGYVTAPIYGNTDSGFVSFNGNTATYDYGNSSNILGSPSTFVSTSYALNTTHAFTLFYDGSVKYMVDATTLSDTTLMSYTNLLEFRNGAGSPTNPGSYVNIYSFAYVPYMSQSNVVFGSIVTSNATIGYYQQQLVIPNPQTYGINPTGSNFEITTQTGSPLYSWIQIINSNEMVVWTNTSYTTSGTETLQLNVLPYFENVLSPTGYIGIAPQYTTSYAQDDNGELVFPHYQNFQGTSLPSGYSFSTDGASYTVNNGITISTSGYFGYFLLPFSIPENSPVFAVMKTLDTTGSAGIGLSPNGGGQPQYISSNGQGLFTVSFGNGGGRGEVYNSGSQWVSMRYVGSQYGIQFENLTSSSMQLITSQNGTFYTANTTSFIVGQGFMTPFFGYPYQQSSSGSFGLYSIYTTVPYISMPSESISSSGQIYQSNSTILNDTYQHYTSFSPYSYNLTEGEYTYQIPDSFSSNYITIYYNSNWTFEYASYGYSSGKEYLSNGSYIPFLTFSNVAGIGTLEITFREPITIGQPLGTMSLGVLPSIAVSGLGFFELPSNYLKWEANGVPINPNSFSVVVGKSISLEAFTASNVEVYNSTYTPTQLNTFLQTSVNITEVQFNNLNSTDEVQVSAISNGATQYEMLLAPYGTGASSGNLYIPSGNYTYKYTELNYTSGAVLNGGTQTAKPVYQNGMYWVTLNGFTIYDLGNQLTETNSSIQKSIQTLSIQIYLNDSAIKQLAVNLSLNMTFVNSTIQDQFTQILSNFAFENSLINGQNITLQDKISAVDSIIKSENLNISDNFTITNSYIKNENISLQDRFQILSSSLENLTFNDSQYFKLEQDSIKNLNLNLSNNFTLTNDIINNFNVSSLNRFDVLNSNIGNMSFNVTQYYTLEQDSIKNLNLNLSDNFSLTNNAIKNVNISQYNRFEILKSNIGNLTFNVSSYYNFEQSSIKNLNINLSNNFSITDSIINNFNLTQKTRFTILNSSISNLTVDASTYFKLEQDSINNLNLNLSDNFTLTNSYIKNANISQYNRYEVLNSNIGNLTYNVSSYYTLENDAINNLSLDQYENFTIISSLIKNVNVSNTNRFLVLNSSIYNLSLNSTSYFTLEQDAIQNLNLNLSENFTLTNSLINNANITQYNKYEILNSAIGNLTFSTKSYYTLENDAIQNLSLNMSDNFTIINSVINNLNITQANRFQILNSTITTLEVNQTSYFTIIHSVVNNISFNASERYQLEKTSGAYAYHFVPKNETLLYNGVDVIAWLVNTAGNPVNNRTLVYSIWKNLTMEYFNLTDNYAVKPTLVSYNNYSVTFFLPLNATQLQSIQNGAGKAEISMYSPFDVGSVSNIAVGTINPSNSNLGNVSAFWSGLGFTSDPPYSSNTFTQLILDVSWFFANPEGRAIIGIASLVPILSFLLIYRSSKDDRNTSVRKNKTDLEIDKIYNKFFGDDAE